MGGEEILWRNTYRMSHCIDCPNSLCGRCTDDMIVCQWRRLLDNLGDWFESEENKNESN